MIICSFLYLGSICHFQRGEMENLAAKNIVDTPVDCLSLLLFFFRIMRFLGEVSADKCEWGGQTRKIASNHGAIGIREDHIAQCACWAACSIPQVASYRASRC